MVRENTKKIYRGKPETSERIHTVVSPLTTLWNPENRLYFQINPCADEGQFYWNHIDLERETAPISSGDQKEEDFLHWYPCCGYN